MDENSAKAADEYTTADGEFAPRPATLRRDDDSTVTSLIISEIMQSGGIASFHLPPSWSSGAIRPRLMLQPKTFSFYFNDSQLLASSLLPLKKCNPLAKSRLTLYTIC